MNQPASTSRVEDFTDAELPSPYLKAMLMRLRIEMKTCAKALQGELLDEFWKIVDELNAMRSGKTQER